MECSIENQTIKYTIDIDVIYYKLIGISIPDQLVITDRTQQMRPVGTWADVFDFIKSKHWHQDGKCTCPHDESLYEHLKDCGRICLENAVSIGYEPKECVKAYFTGLLHDIGKPGTMRQLSKHLAFKGHGLVGGAILENFWSDQIEVQLGLTKEDWGDISTCADVHMCSYFEGQTSSLHKYSVNILPNGVKKMLSVLAIGDQLSMRPSDTYTKTWSEIEQFVKSSHPEYLNTLFSQSISIESIDKKQGVLLFIQGSSASGKSTFAKKLIERFGDHCSHVNRDYYMVRQTMKIMGETPIQSFDEITPELYQRCHQKYVNSGKLWASQINDGMRRDISEGLQLGKIVIVDTLATMFDAIDGIIPDNAKDAYRMAFWIHRNQLITDAESTNRLGMVLSTQLEVHGDKSIWNPLNNRVSWSKMISATESRDIDVDWKNQAHLSISVGWNGIKEHILTYLFDQIELMYQYNQTLPRVPILNQSMHMTLLELVQELNNIGGLEAIVQFFSTYAYTVSRYIPGVIGIKYIDGVNQIWQPNWAREARGRFYWIGLEKGTRVVELKSALQRGIEIITKAHIDSGIDTTQDVEQSKSNLGSTTNSSELVEPKSWDKFDPVQRHLLKIFAGSNPIDSVLTGKVDGSLLIGNIYPKSSVQYPIIKELALTYGDKFTQSIISYCVEHGLDLVTISTQGTLFIGDEMQDYFLTAIQPLIVEEIKTMDDWEWVGPKFVQIILDYYQTLKLDNVSMVNMCFEAYCKNRITITGKLHTELAVGYDHSGLNLLGMMYQSKYVPHFDMVRKVFKQPVYYRISNTEQVYRLMKELDGVVLGTRTMDQFMSNFEIDEFTSPIAHAEGFVLLTPLTQTLTQTLTQDPTQEPGLYDYAKIKTQMYYRCHKVRQDNIQQLLKLPDSCSKFYPILSSMHKFFDNLDSTIYRLVSESYQALNSQITRESALYQMQNVKGQARWNAVIDSTTSELVTENNKMVQVVFRMMLNTNGSTQEIIKIIGPITQELYQSESEQIVMFVKGLLMKVEPWKSEWESRLKDLFLTFDDTINQLYGIVVGFTD